MVGLSAVWGSLCLGAIALERIAGGEACFEVAEGLTWLLRCTEEFFSRIVVEAVRKEKGSRGKKGN